MALQKHLQRTIIFVSHDLDEAFKIGSRIAIMDDGRIVQQGTARELVLDPETDYVADFVAHVNPMSVWRAQDVMRMVDVAPPMDAVALGSNTIGKAMQVVTPADAPLKVVIRALEQTGRPVFVERHGTIIGSISVADVVAILAAQ